MGRPLMQHQGPDSNCIIQGVLLGWESCTAFAVAMAADASTDGRVRIDGCQWREETGDRVGGTKLSQYVPSLLSRNIVTEIHVGPNVCSPAYAARKLTGRRPIVLQGNISALIGTPFQSNGVGVNHAVAIVEVRGGTSDVPAEALVYDPAADGRGSFASGPAWWPWSLVLRFAAALKPNGDDSAVRLGAGKFYCLIFPAAKVPLPDTGTAPYRIRIAHNATVRIYKLKGKGRAATIESWTDDRWEPPASGAPCEQPIHRSTTDRKSGATTVRVTAGVFTNKYVRLGSGVVLTGG